ncbi:MAG: CBO0543 family protein, partial [Bacillus sp. (in: firmicutes)]
MELILMHIPSFDDIQDARRILSNLSVNHWKQDDLFSPSWWFLLAATIFPYIIWWRVVDKSRYFEIFSFGLISACFSVVLDVIGVDLLWWGYPDKLFSMIPPLFPADMVVIPVTLMIIYQFNKSWTSF